MYTIIIIKQNAQVKGKPGVFPLASSSQIWPKTATHRSFTLCANLPCIVSTLVCVGACMCVDASVCVGVCMCVCVHVCVCVCTCVCMCVYASVCA